MTRRTNGRMERPDRPVARNCTCGGSEVCTGGHGPEDDIRKLEPDWYEVTCGSCGYTWETSRPHERCPLCTEGG